MVYLLFVFISIYINAKEDPTEICINNESAISGCTFSNIERENSSYFIKLDKDILFYGNSFDFSTFDYNPIPVYLSNIFQGKITVSQCSFIKCNSIESDANVLICNGEVDITIENCQFINCGENISHAIVKLNANNEHLMNFTNCIFHFDNENSSCYVFKTKCSVRLIFDHCQFIKCPIIKTNHKMHSLQFTYNVVDSANRMIIFINYLEFELNIKSNVFKNNNNLISSEFITLKHDLVEIELINNSFSDISSDKSFYVFSTVLYFKRITKLKSYIVICECKFINIQSKYSAIMIGSLSKTVNIKLNLTNSEFIDNLCINGNGGALSVNNIQELSIINCYFKDNKAFRHGGAISLYIATKVEIVSCTFEDNIANYAPSFIHNSKKVKIIAGSPAMGAYIIEALMNRSLSKNSVDSIKKIVYGNDEGFIREYATENTKGRTKQWVCLNINYWESNIISEEKILLNQDINHMEIKDIMKSIGYKLIACCKLEFNEKNNCITKKMQPLFNSQKTPNFIGVRLISINQHYDFNKTIFEEDVYYSNGSCDKPEGSNNQTNYLDYTSNFSSTSSFDNFLDDMDYDMVIPHKYIVKISYEAIKEFMPYPVRIVTVFEYELNEMSKNEKFLKKFISNNKEITEKMPYEFKLMVYNWIRHFLPTYELRELIDDFVLLFYKFTVKFDIPIKDAESIFYKCMNIADQVASQLSCIDKKKAYYDERLKK